MFQYGTQLVHTTYITCYHDNQISPSPPLQEHQVSHALLKRRSAFEQLVGGILHRKQLWFHGAIDRPESEQRMKMYGLKDGLFLIRERTQVRRIVSSCCGIIVIGLIISRIKF